MSNFPKKCLVLRAGVTRDHFQSTATALGFVHHGTQPGDGVQKAFEQVWATPDQTTAVNYLECPLSKLHYVVIRGPQPRHFETEFASRIAAYSSEELIEGAVEATEFYEQVRAINRLAIGFAEYDAGAFALLEMYSTKPEDPLLREAAVNAMGFRAWPQFRSLLERLASQDPAENVRQRSEAILPHIPVE